MITCPNCGDLTKDEIIVHMTCLRKYSFGHSPILPRCKMCNTDVMITNKCNGGNIVMLTGTNGSGKSTVAEVLTQKGFLAIDGDCVAESVKYRKNGIYPNFGDMVDEFALEIDIISMYSDNIVFSHVIDPSSIDSWINIVESRNLTYTVFLLKPDLEIAVERNRERTSRVNIIPDWRVENLYKKMIFDKRVITVNNSNITPEETAEYILRQINYVQI